MFHVILFGSITGAVLYGQLHEMSSIIYPEIGIPLNHFGYISLTITLLGGLAGVWAYKVRERLGYSYTFTVILLISTVSIYLYSLATLWWHILFLVLAIFVLEMVTPLTEGYMHHQIGDKFRVTISSLDAFIKNACTIMISLLFGIVAEKSSIYVGFKLLSLLLLFYGIASLISFVSLKKRFSIQDSR